MKAERLVLKRRGEDDEEDVVVCRTEEREHEIDSVVDSLKEGSHRLSVSSLIMGRQEDAKGKFVAHFEHKRNLPS